MDRFLIEMIQSGTCSELNMRRYCTRRDLQYLLCSIMLFQCDVETATGVYSCLSVDMMFKRQLSYYVFTIYVPTFMTVCVSWMSFWLDHKESFFLTDIFRYLEQETLFSTILIDKNESFADVVRPGAGDVDHHHSTGHVHHHLQYQQLPPARRLH